MCISGGVWGGPPPPPPPPPQIVVLDLGGLPHPFAAKVAHQADTNGKLSERPNVRVLAVPAIMCPTRKSRLRVPDAKRRGAFLPWAYLSLASKKGYKKHCQIPNDT